MLELTDLAVKKLKEFQEVEGPEQSVRVAIVSGSAKSPNLGIVSDDATEADEVFDFDGLPLIIDKALMEYCKKIEIEIKDYTRGNCCSWDLKIFILDSIPPPPLPPSFLCV